MNNDDSYTPYEIQEEIKDVMIWAAKVAVEHVDLAHFAGETVDPEPCDGLWQSYQAEFDKDKQDAMGIRQMAWAVFCQTLATTVILMDAKARQVTTMGATVDGLGPVTINA